METTTTLKTLTLLMGIASRLTLLTLASAIPLLGMDTIGKYNLKPTISHQCVKDVIDKYKSYEEFDKKQYKHLMKISSSITEIIAADENADQISLRMRKLLFSQYPDKTDYIIVLEKLCNAWKEVDGRNN